MSSTQLAKKIVTIGIYRYLTIYRATPFSLISFYVDTTNCTENEW